jgi:diguanylate cyclase (GGDEF)-like protein
VSRLKGPLKFAAGTCALALLMLVALASGTALGADGGQSGDSTKVVTEGLPVPQDVVPPGLVGSDPGDGGLNLGEIIPPVLTQPGPGGSPEQTGPATPEAKPASSKPAASPKHKTPARKIADAGTQRAPGRPVRNAPSSSPARKRVRQHGKDFNPSAFHRAETTTPTDSEPSRPASPSIVASVINRIPAEYQIALVGLAALSLMFALVSLRERRRSRRVEREALVDPLTALPNRQAFERRLAKEWRRADRYDRELGVLMLDLDDFKQINDGQGHAAGDRVLSEAAMLISGRIRSTDMPARWGGDEFVVLCPETNGAGLKVLARSLEDRLKHAGITSSAGFAGRESGDLGPADLLARADASMYRRKQRERARPERRSVTLSDSRRSFAPLSD